MPSKCEHDGCEKRPVFNVRGAKKGRYCADHKLPGMVDVKNPHCEHEGCEKWPGFNVRGAKKGRYCADHKLPGMVDVMNPHCEHDGCEKRPVFDVRGAKKGRYCTDHKLPGMVDVKNPKCEHDGCEKRPSFGVPGRRPSRCFQHQEVGMIRNPLTVCCLPSCKDVATYGVRSPNHCELHAHPEERRLLGDSCASCGLVDLLDDAGLCSYCDPYTFRRVRLAKQREVKVSLDCTEHRDYDLYDETVDRGECGKERPDFAWDCGTHWVVLEVDENQHKDRQETCECVRMVNVSQSFGGVPVVFVRYNPDEYQGRKNESLAQRMKVVERWLGHLRSNPPASFLSFVQLFYDGYDEASAVLRVVLQFHT